jgi:hypothetical protein
MIPRTRYVVAVFAVLQVLSWVAYHQLWLTPWWWSARIVLGAISLIVAILLVVSAKRRRWALPVVVFGLVIGQWHLIFGFLTRLAARSPY